MSSVERLDGGDDRNSKEDVLIGLMAKGPFKKDGGSLIEEVGVAPKVQDVGSAEPPVAQKGTYSREDDGPSMMELMMAAQAEAATGKAKEKAKERKRESSGFGAGFKKGFFGGKASKPKTKTENKSPEVTKDVIPTIKGQKKKSGVAGITKEGHVLDEVQAAMAAEEAKKAAGVGGADWVTPDLMQAFASSPILARGLASPKCTAALQALQGGGLGPNASAEERRRKAAEMESFKKDAEVDEFIREFGRVMGTHFERLGKEQDEANARVDVTEGKAAQPRVQELDEHGQPVGEARTAITEPEMGPLHKRAVERAAEAERQKRSGIREVSRDELKQQKQHHHQQQEPVDDNKVKEIVNDPELSAILMDAKMQKILQECNDPMKFQEHMRNPETARKIKKLFDAGLVGTAR